jgi:PAS domain-containing protein/DNA-binding CsgD family transcriptional regulator
MSIRRLRVGDLLSLTDAFSAAAIDPTLWVRAMDAAAQVTGSVGAGLLPIRGHLPTIPVGQSVGELFDRYFRERWFERDERYRGLPALMRRGVMSDLDFATPDEFARSAYYQELFAPLGLQWFVGIKVAAGDDVWCVAIQRSIKQGPLPQAEMAKLGALSRQLSSAAALARAIGFAHVDTALRAFELSGSAVVLIDRSGEVLRVNGAAEKVLRTRDLRIVGKKIVSWDRSATAALDRALHALIWRNDASLHTPVVFPRHQGRPILAYASRLTANATDFFAPCQAVIVLVDLEAKLSLVESDLMKAFNLTPAEARLAGRILGGEAIDIATKKLGITSGTGRNQLKAVFQKTGTGRQGELTALLARVASPNR